MDAAEPDTGRSLGWPWDRLAEAVERRQDAERFVELGTSLDRAKAAFELEEALRLEQECRDELAGVFLLMLGEAIRQRPEALFGKLMAAADEVLWKDIVTWLVDAKPGGAEQWLAMSRRVAAAEEAAAARKAEAWRLAVAVAQLEERVAEMERTTHAGHAGPSHADTRQADGAAPGRQAG